MKKFIFLILVSTLLSACSARDHYVRLMCESATVGEQHRYLRLAQEAQKDEARESRNSRICARYPLEYGSFQVSCTDTQLTSL